MFVKNFTYCYLIPNEPPHKLNKTCLHFYKKFNLGFLIDPVWNTTNSNICEFLLFMHTCYNRSLTKVVIQISQMRVLNNIVTSEILYKIDWK